MRGSSCASWHRCRPLGAFGAPPQPDREVLVQCQIQHRVSGCHSLLGGDVGDRARSPLLVGRLGDFVDVHVAPQRRGDGGALRRVAVVVLDRVTQFGACRRVRQQCPPLGPVAGSASAFQLGTAR